MSDCGNISELECQIIKEQIARREKYRMEFLRLRTDPSQHCLEAGYVFDPAIQRFASMKCTQTELFIVSRKTVSNAFWALLPMFIYGAAIWKQRSLAERDYRCGKIRYRDRLFKLQ